MRSRSSLSLSVSQGGSTLTDLMGPLLVAGLLQLIWVPALLLNTPMFTKRAPAEAMAIGLPASPVRTTSADPEEPIVRPAASRTTRQALPLPSHPGSTGSTLAYAAPAAKAGTTPSFKISASPAGRAAIQASAAPRRPVELPRFSTGAPLAADADGVYRPPAAISADQGEPVARPGSALTGASGTFAGIEPSGTPEAPGGHWSDPTASGENAVRLPVLPSKTTTEPAAITGEAAPLHASVVNTLGQVVAPAPSW
ncbi:MAG: hypothetical protein ACK55H_08755 [Cyanobacteriota bacterium]|jgi:hypothetical protein